MVSGQAARAGGPGDPAAPQARRAGPDRADHDAVLSPDPAAPASTRTAAREAMPDVALPELSRRLPRRRRRAGRAARSRATSAISANDPRGMWPSEGSVSQAIIPLLAEAGIEWIATDEEILGCSTHGKVGRDSRGHVRHPELLYRAWKVRESDHELAIIFRDHSMSDQIGFHYQRSPGPVAAGDFMGKLAAHRRRLPRINPATLVPVILDGENCWEYYPDGGVSFLRSLYQGMARQRRIFGRSRSAEFLEEHPPARHAAPAVRRKLDQPQLRDLGRPPRRQSRLGLPCTPPARSWSRKSDRCRHEAGHPGKGLERDLHRRGLRLVLVVRRRSFQRAGRPVRPSVPQAPAQRLHAAGLRPAGVALRRRSRAAVRHRPLHDQPLSFSHVKIDGRATYFEWIDAARYACGNERGTMTQVASGLLESVWFGFDAERLLDSRRHRREGRAREVLAEADRLRIGFVEPAEREIVVMRARRRACRSAYLNHAGGMVANGTTIQAATGAIFELAVPFARLELETRRPDPVLRRAAEG